MQPQAKEQSVLNLFGFYIFDGTRISEAQTARGLQCRNLPCFDSQRSNQHLRAHMS